MDNYKTGHINLPPQSVGADLHRSDTDTRSFGESHAAELSSIDSEHSGTSDVRHPGIPATPPVAEYKPHSQPPAPFKPSETNKLSSAPINVADLNQSPSPIPPTSSLQSTPAPAIETQPLDSVPANMPTVAETGIPVSAGTEGPGPASGSLHGLREATQPRVPVQPEQPPPGPSPFESAEDEKKRLEREERERVLKSGLSGQGDGRSPFESAEDEKKRLEREERERILKSGPSGQGDAKKDADEDLPPPQYQEM